MVLSINFTHSFILEQYSSDACLIQDIWNGVQPLKKSTHGGGTAPIASAEGTKLPEKIENSSAVRFPGIWE
jgi:hypothetical protein